MEQALTASQRETRAKILDTAVELFYERGVHAVGVNEIAARAHASKLSLYRYFPSKANLVEQMLAEHSDRIHGWLRRRAGQGSPPDRVEALFDALIEWFAQPGYRGCAVVNTVTDTRADPAVAAVARRHLARYRGLLTESLDTLGPGVDADALARRLLLLIEGASVVATIEPDGAAGRDAKAAARMLVDAAARN
ncbi:TetR/AcrR family transcriptional regulator [Tsukamurella sp. 8F]|uniref:TetR/AcrR family transcriptional regulator n=1 Tax=unclassified Tsukamurella TaxID=2633480 RepID=UPI0023B97264|nr:MULTISPECIES: TetR/AcrR family transcriptional regulator [unclassified Tsukamurella]MDF0530060.1 TetR/AcrR family transcriptional regulator [Tsukamurella sp. 8J]MDF0586378.1 TetR/AcrR family transcriptional regulator [Tsukamurella sp. 8F]